MSQVRDGWSTTGTGGADQGTVRRANLSLVLRSLREGGNDSTDNDSLQEVAA